jgi:hypothetical protein
MPIRKHLKDHLLGPERIEAMRLAFEKALATATKHPDVLVRLDGPGDDFRIVGQVTEAMRRFGIPDKQIKKFCDEAMSGHDDDLLRLCRRWVTLE